MVGKRDQRLAYSKEFESLPFKNVDGRDEKNAVRIAVKEEQEEKVILCYSATRASKEKAIFSKAEQYYLEDLTKLKRRIETGKLKDATKIHKALGRLSERHHRIVRYYDVNFDEKKGSLSWCVKSEKQEPACKASGCYCLRSSKKDLDDRMIWNIYIMLTRVESGFKILKSHLGLRPIYHHREDRCDSHVFITVLAYRLLHYIEYLLQARGETRSWKTIRRILKTHVYATITLLDTKGRRIHIRTLGVPEKEQRQLYELLGVKYNNLPRRQLRFT